MVTIFCVTRTFVIGCQQSRSRLWDVKTVRCSFPFLAGNLSGKFRKGLWKFTVRKGGNLSVFVAVFLKKFRYYRRKSIAIDQNLNFKYFCWFGRNISTFRLTEGFFFMFQYAHLFINSINRFYSWNSLGTELTHSRLSKPHLFFTKIQLQNRQTIAKQITNVRYQNKYFKRFSLNQ